MAGVAVWFCSRSLPAHAAGENFTQKDAPIPRLQPASDEGQRAIAKMHPAKGLKVELWAAEPLLANPVALNFDNQGRCYVIETWRLDHGVVDIRGHMDWLDDDLSSKTVEERMKMVKRKMGPNAWTFGQYPDVVRLLEDASGSGRADKSTVFAEFDDPADGLAAGIVARKGNVYLTNIPHLWLLKDTTGSGHADVRKSLSFGYGIRYNFIGHDLHGPRFGPDGKLYFSMGDRGANIEQSVDGRHVQNLESGCVFRCNADGSGLEVFANGLRNPQSLAFDEYGNLFTGDNNPDYGDPARWVYLVEDGDSGWRVGYQEDRHPIGGGPWMWEHLWQTQDKSNAAYLIPPIAHLGAGPSGVAYYPGTSLSSQYDNHFFECDFRGGFSGSGVHTFVMEPQGAGFKMADLHNFVWDTLATDIVFGPQGGAYITDWVQGWDVSGKGRIYHVIDPQGMSEPIVAHVRKLLAEGFEKRSPQELLALLKHRDQRIRQEAQFELADRGAEMVSILSEAAARTGGDHLDQLSRIHAIWALGQIATKAPAALAPIRPLLNDADPEIRAQAARVLGDHRDADSWDSFVKMLSDASLRARYFATMALAKLGNKNAIPAILQMLRENEDRDAYLRHAGVMALVRTADWPSIQEAAKDGSRAVRMAALLAMRRLARPEIAMFLHDPDPQFVLEAARAVNDLPMPAALPQLAALVGEPNIADYVRLRAINANYRLGTGGAAQALARFANNSNAPERWRREALDDLTAWHTPGHLDRVTNLPRPLPDRDPNIARNAVAPILTDILHSAPDRVRVAALNLIQKLGVTDSKVLAELVADTHLSANVRVAAVQALAARNDPRLADSVKTALADQNERVRAEAIRATAKLPDPARRVLPHVGKGTVVEQQAAFDALGDVPGKEADGALSVWMDKLLHKQVNPAIELDVLEAAEKRPSPQVQEKVREYQQSLPKTDELAAYRVSLEGGDPASGEAIFREKAEVSCLRCHAVRRTGGIVGPALDGIGAKQSREYLLESIVLPNAKIAPGYESVILKLHSGSTVTGIVKRETKDKLLLVDADGNRMQIDKSDIESRQRGQSAMPEGLVKFLTPRELRDLVEYLASLKR